MKINRHNYEEFFILYMDNELDAAGRREVELFIGKNPDLKEELDLLQQFRLTPDTNIVFEGKEELMSNEMSAITQTIDLSNYEEWLVLYMDNELTGPQQKMVERFVHAEPVAKKELEILQLTKLQPEQLVFSDKASLYRTSEKVRELPVRGSRAIFSSQMWRVAAAVLLLLLAGTIAMIVFNDRKTSGTKNEEIVKTGDPVEEKNNTPAPVVKYTENNTPSNEPMVADRTNKQDNNLVKKDDQNQVALIKDKKDKVKNDLNNIVVDNIKKEEPVIANNNSVETNNLPQPLNDPNTRLINSTANNKNDISKETQSPNNSLTPSAVTTASLNSSNNGDEIESPAGGKKSKLRGILRKVTRTFEKRTNIDATDDDERLLVGGLAIKLK